MAPIKRLEFARDKHLCFNCLRPAKHSAQTCHLDLKCRAEGCNVRHSSLLHDGFEELQRMKATPNNVGTQPPAVNNNAAVSDVISANASSTVRRPERRTALPIVGIKIAGANGSSVDTYALLDTGSDRTFCLPSLLTDLQLKGKDTTLTLHTLNSVKKVKATEVSLDIQPLIDAYDGVKFESMHLPNVCAIQSFPTLTNGVVRSTDIDDFAHLVLLYVRKRQTSQVSVIVDIC